MRAKYSLISFMAAGEQQHFPRRAALAFQVSKSNFMLTEDWSVLDEVAVFALWNNSNCSINNKKECDDIDFLQTQSLPEKVDFIWHGRSGCQLPSLFHPLEQLWRRSRAWGMRRVASASAKTAAVVVHASFNLSHDVVNLRGCTGWVCNT